MTLSYHAIRLACRQQVLGMAQCSTGATTLHATASGYGRTSGSFLADGFAPGMEVTAQGFQRAANNGVGLVTHVAEKALVVEGYTLTATDGAWTRTARGIGPEAAGAGRTLAVGLPTVRAWEGLRIEPIDGIPWVEEQLIGGPTHRPTLTGSGPVVAEPQYQLVFHHVADLGSAAIDRTIDALVARFPPGQGLSLASGRTLRVRTDAGPFTTRLGRLRPGFLTTAVTFPLRLYTPVLTN